MTYNKLYDILQIVMQDLASGDNKVTEENTGTWNFEINGISGQLTLQQNEDDDLLTLILHLFVVPLPETQREDFLMELLTFNANSPFLKYSLHENYALASVVFQEFSFFNKEFFSVVIRRYLTFAQETRADLGTRYFS